MPSGSNTKRGRRSEKRAIARGVSLAQSSHRRKLDWSRRHIDLLIETEADWLSDGYLLNQRTNSRGHQIIEASLTRSIPAAYPLVVGDALSCMRQSLDHLVFALSVAHTPDLSDEEAREPQFPLSSRTPKPLTPSHPALRFMSPEARAALVKLAPDLADVAGCKAHPLWLLNSLQNVDKHREITVAAAAAGIHDLGITNAHIKYLSTHLPLLSASPAVVIEWSVGPGAEWHATAAVTVVFGHEHPDVALRKVIETLEGFYSHIDKEVAPVLEAYLP